MCNEVEILLACTATKLPPMPERNDEVLAEGSRNQGALTVDDRLKDSYTAVLCDCVLQDEPAGAERKESVIKRTALQKEPSYLLINIEKITGDQPDIRTSLVTGFCALIQIHNGHRRMNIATMKGANQKLSERERP